MKPSQISNLQELWVSEGNKSQVGGFNPSEKY